jgi:hypothetical protein
MWKQQSCHTEKEFKVMPQVRKLGQLSFVTKKLVTVTAVLYCGTVASHLLQETCIAVPQRNARPHPAN